MKKNFSKQHNRGVALLIAILISSVMLAVGLGVYQRTYKATVFSSFWKQSQIAFGAADGGLECALFHDLHLSAPAVCFGTAIPPASWTPGTSGNFEATTPGGGCVIVTITKDLLAAQITTLIQSRGYNDGCLSTNPRRVERGIQMNY